MNTIKKAGLMFTFFFIIQIFVLAEPPETARNWCNETFASSYKMNFEATYTIHYVNIEEKNINEETGDVGIEVIDSYVPSFDIPKTRWEGEIVKDSQGRTRMDVIKYDFNNVGSQDDKVTTITHYMNSDISLSLYHTKKLSRRASMKNAPLMLEWPFWVTSLSNTEKYLKALVTNWEYDWEIVSNTPGEGAVFNLRNDQMGYLAKLVFDNKNYLVEFDENTETMRKDRKFNYVKTDQGLVISDIIYSRYYNKNIRFDGPMETFEFHANPYTAQIQNLTAFNEWPSIPEDYEKMDEIDKYYIDKKGIYHEMKTRTNNP